MDHNPNPDPSKADGFHFHFETPSRLFLRITTRGIVRIFYRSPVNRPIATIFKHYTAQA
jgi:hypothetical protein